MVGETEAPTTRDLIDLKSSEKYDVGPSAPKNKLSAKWLSETEKDIKREPFSAFTRKHRQNGYAWTWCEYYHAHTGTMGQMMKLLDEVSRPTLPYPYEMVFRLNGERLNPHFQDQYVRSNNQ